MADEVWHWWAGQNEEWFELGPFDCKADAINDGVAEYEGDPFWVMSAVSGKLQFSAKRMIDEQYFEADDLFDFDRSEPGRRGSKEEAEIADKALQDMIDAWTFQWSHTFVTPTMFSKHGEMHRIAPDDRPPDAQ